MKPGLTEIICVIDKSGSMESKLEDAIGGFNGFLAEQQREEGEALMTLTLFDTDYNIIHDGVPVADVPRLTADTYRPGGMTALLDALGRTIDKVADRIHDAPGDERPERVVVVVITDGLENSSREYRRDQVAERIVRRRDEDGWEFVFLGADLESIREAQSMGIEHTSVGTTTGADLSKSYTTVSRIVSLVRRGHDLDDDDSWKKKPN